MRDFLLQLPHGGILADIGCGNGKYFGVRPDLILLGSDRSTGLALQAMKLCKPPSRLRAAGAVSVGFPHSESPPAGAVMANGESAEAERLRQLPDSCQLGRSSVHCCSLADVVVADAMRLPYKVRNPGDS